MINAIFEEIDGKFVMTGYAADGYQSTSEQEKVVETSEQELVDLLDQNLSESVDSFEEHTAHVVLENGEIAFSETEVSEV